MTGRCSGVSRNYYGAMMGRSCYDAMIDKKRTLNLAKAHAKPTKAMNETNDKNLSGNLAGEFAKAFGSVNISMTDLMSSES